MKKKCIGLVIAIIAIILGCFISSSVDSNYGTVKTTRINLVDADGYRFSANLYVPVTATAENPAPAMIISPGGDCNADIASPWASELSRRGYVVAAVDYTGAGETENNPNDQYFGAGGSMGLDTMYDYLASCGFVDAEQIGVGGHSMGSLYSYRLALSREVKVVISDVLYTDPMPDYNFNFIQIAAEHDEGILARIPTFDLIYEDEFLTELFGTDKIEPNKIYGSWEEGNVRVLYPLNQTHQDDMVSGQFISIMLESVMNSMEAPNPIDANNMIYGTKIVGLAMAIVGLVIFMFVMAGILLDSSLFSSLKLKKQEEVHYGFAYKTKAWWLYYIILAAIPVIMFFPGTALGNKMAANKFFQLGSTPNGYMVWTLLSAILLVVVTIIFHNVYGKKHGGSLKAYGFATTADNKVGIGYIVKAAVFSLILFMLGYFIIMLVFQYANTDLHLWTMSLRPLTGERLATMPWYFIGFLPYFLMFTLAGKGLGLESEKISYKKSVFIGTICGVTGLLILFIIYEIILRTSRPFYTGDFAHFYMSLLENVIPSFGVAMGLNLYIGRKTKSIYAGIFIGAAIVAFGIVSTNCLGMIVD